MTIIHIKSRAGDDYFYTESDEDQVEDAVEELTDEYNDTPEDEQESDLAEYVLNGLDERGFDVWRAGVVMIDGDCV